MLEATDSGQFRARCDKCHGVRVVVASNRDAAVAELKREGWMEAAQRGKGLDRWLWWCLACAPKPPSPSSFGRSTP